MVDSINKLAKNIVEYSLDTQKGEKVIIWGYPDSKPLMLEVGNLIRKHGAHPTFLLFDDDLVLNLLLSAEGSESMDAVLDLGTKHYHELMDKSDSFIAIRSKNADNPYPGVSKEILQKWQMRLGSIFAKFTNQMKWVVFDWPTQLQADKMNMEYGEFFDYVMNMSAMDYRRMEKAAVPLKELLEKTNRVRITGNGTDLEFSIKNIPVIMGTAKNSYIDGEVYTAPVKDSINGKIKYTIPSIYLGNTFKGISFTFKNGRIVEASCEDGSDEALENILNTDEGSRFIGEFALGINRYVIKAMNDIHYDEKMITSFHLTPGNCYDDAPNGNKSAIHWDLVCDQSESAGGGEIWFDEVLIKKDGIYILPELKELYGI